MNDNGSAADVVTELFNFTYSGGFLKYVTNAEGLQTNLGYTEINGLKRMFRFSFTDGYRAEYAYSSDGAMTKAYDCEAKVGVGFDYHTFLGTKCVQKVREFAANTIDGTETVGSQWHFWVYNKGLKEYRFYGPDQTPETSDDTIARYVFDHTGKTVTITNYDYNKANILGVTNTSYTSNSNENTKTKNRVSGASATGNVAVNLLNNAGAERQDDTSAYAWTVAKSSTAGMATAFRSCVEEANPDVAPHTGGYLLKTWMNNSNVSNTSDTSSVGMYQKVYLTQNTTYVFSGWANTRAVENYGLHGGLVLQFRNTSGSVLAESELLDFATTKEINDGWSRLEVSFQPTSTGWYRVYAVQKNAGGYGAFDDLLLETNKSNTSVSGASTANLVQLGSFELWNGTTADRTQDPAYWTYDTSKATPSASGALSGYDKNGHFLKKYRSAGEAAKELGVRSKQTINSACQHTKKSAYGYIWRYENDNVPIEQTVSINRSIQYSNGTSNRPQKVLQIKDGRVIHVFNSANEAGRAMGCVNGANIVACCKGKHKSAYGYQWRYDKAIHSFPHKVHRHFILSVFLI